MTDDQGNAQIGRDKFQVNLQGLIDLLSNHLYSGPEVYLRELLQNAQDAITARQRAEEKNAAVPTEGVVRIELISQSGQPPTLVVTDNGIGLTEPEVHRFLATIGESSKRIQAGKGPTDFIGRFGVGLLACFMVSDEIVVVTRSISSDKSVTWRGKQDGTYTVSSSQNDLEVGTRVYLTCRKGCEEWMKVDQLVRLAKHFGGLLPHRIEVCHGDSIEIANFSFVPWRDSTRHGSDANKQLLRFGEEFFEQTFLDAIPLRTKKGIAQGAAYVLSHPASLVHPAHHTIYLKGMLITEKDDSILPSWALFTKAIVDAQDLSPTASRDSLCQDRKLEECREQFGDCIRQYLIELAEKRPEKLARIVQTHLAAIRELAIEDDDCFLILIPYIPFETTDGRLTIPEFLQRHSQLNYVTSVEQFRQIAPVASAQNIGVINAGYVHSVELLEKYAWSQDSVTVEAIDTERFSQNLEDLTAAEEDAAENLIQVATKEMKRFRCKVELKGFEPSVLTALYTLDEAGQMMRSIEQSRDVSNSLFADALGAMMNQSSTPYVATLFLNYRNPLIRKLATIRQSEILSTSLRMLYVQSLLQAHQPLQAKEMQLLTSGMLDLVEIAVVASENRGESS